MRKKLLLIPLALLLAIALVAIGCPTPPEEPTTPTEPTTPAPVQEKMEIEIYSNPLGHSTYVLSFALAEIINKNSTWLHVTCIESKGSSANLIYLQQNPAAWENTIVMLSPFTVVQGEKAEPPFDSPFTGMKAISLIADNAAFFLTSDPDIKTISDLAGRSVGLGLKGITLEYIPRFILDYGCGVYSDIGKVSNSGFNDLKSALLDGTIDVALQSSAAYGDEEYKDWEPIPATAELLATKVCYLVDIEEEAFTKAREMSGYPIYVMKAKPLAFGKSPAFGGNRMWWSNSWWVHESMDDDVVREICAIIYEHANEFVTYHATGIGITPETVASIACPEGDFHPAAAEFYKEVGLSVGQ
ncbi:hypothetical protein ES705_09325 [subsurface metagenome]